MIRWLWYKNDFYVEMIPRTADHAHLMGPTLKSIGLKTVDKRKHWEGEVRRGIVRQMNPSLRSDVNIGDVVIFGAASGFTMDGDVIDDGLDVYGKGEGHRWLRESEVLAVEEPSVVPSEQEAVHV